MLSFFPLDVLDEIWDVIESVSEGFLTYSSIIFMNFYILAFPQLLKLTQWPLVAVQISF